MSDEVPLAQQQVSPHGLEVLQQQVVAVQDIQQIFAGVEISGIDFLLERPLQVGQELCSYEEAWSRVQLRSDSNWSQQSSQNNH